MGSFSISAILISVSSAVVFCSLLVSFSADASVGYITVYFTGVSLAFLLSRGLSLGSNELILDELSGFLSDGLGSSSFEMVFSSTFLFEFLG